MRFLLIPVLLLLCGLQGCFPLPQMEQQPSRVAFHANYDAGDKYVLFAIGAENHPKDYEIVAPHSYVFDIAQHYPFVRDDVFVLRSEADSRPIRLHDGTWSFVLARRVSGSEHQDTFPFRLSTFYYSPLIHGPPN
jgi:hypothetical protein